MPSLLEISLPSLIAGLAYIGATRSEHTFAVVLAMGGALGCFFMLYFFSVMEKFPIVLTPPPPQQPQPQPTLEQLFGAEEVPAPAPAPQMQEVNADQIPQAAPPEPEQQEPRPHRRKIVIREYYDEEKPRTARQLEKKIQAQLEKIAVVEQKAPARRTPAERVRLATRTVLEQLLADLRANPQSEEQIRRHVDELLV